MKEEGGSAPGSAFLRNTVWKHPSYLRHAPHAAQQHANTTCQRNNVDRADLGCEFERRTSARQLLQPGHQADTQLLLPCRRHGRMSDGRMQTADGRGKSSQKDHAGALLAHNNENCNSPRGGCIGRAATVPAPAQYKCLPIHLPLTCMPPTRPTLLLQE
jgi:hypothetical protein